MSKWKRPLVLASSSERRGHLLEEFGISVQCSPPQFDDGIFTCGSITVERWVQTLAVMKAQNVQGLQGEMRGTILAADTVCVVDEAIIGQPVDARDATKMIQSMEGKSHQVFTGWCLLSMEDAEIAVGFEAATIVFGELAEDEIKKYIATGSWQGKAGGYNLSERIEAGWPIECDGDPTSVMGLPMKRLSKELSKE